VILPAPVLEQHRGIFVVRDDLLPGGTKVRFLARLFALHDVVAYASPACGGAQLALAHAAHAARKQAVIFVAKRKVPHARTREAHAAGARVFQVPHGYLSNVQAKAKLYCADTGAHLLQFGGESPEAIAAIAGVAAAVWSKHGPFDEVWCAAGSGVLTRGLQAGMPDARRFVAVQVGRSIERAGRAEVLRYPLEFEAEERSPAPFPSCPNYDRKAWKMCAERGRGRVLFWNVLGPSPTV
jgi:hypothetical protein